MGRIASLFVVLALVATATQAASASNGRYSSIVVNAADGRVLHASAADARRNAGAMAELVTVYLALEAVRAGELLLDERVLAMPQTDGAPLPTVRDAIEATVNGDAAAADALAQLLAPDAQTFAAMRRLRARALDASAAAHGDAATARALARIAARLHDDFPELLEAAIRIRLETEIATRVNVLAATNDVRTGHGAVMSETRNGARLIVVVTGAPDEAARDRHAALLLDLAFQSMSEDEARDNEATFIRASADQDEAAPGRRLRIVVLDQDEMREADNAEDDAETAPPEIDAPTPDATPSAADDDAGAAPIATDETHTADLGEAAAPDPASAVWFVQVGAFSTEEAARARLDAVSRAMPEPFGAAERSALPSEDDGALWRARFTGFGEDGARSACDSLRASGERCFSGES